MKMRKFLKFQEMPPAKQRKALIKILRKLERKHEALREELNSAITEKKRLKLKAKLKINKHHRHKAERLIAALGE